MVLNELETALCRAVEEAFDSEQLTWFARIVEQPSFTGAREDVEAAAAIIDAAAKDIGLGREIVPDPQGVYADHRVYSTPAVSDEDRALALVGHCDTVYPRSMGFLQFRRDPSDAPSSGDRVRGPGVLDMKSGLSVILFGLRAVVAGRARGVLSMEGAIFLQHGRGGRFAQQPAPVSAFRPVHHRGARLRRRTR